MNVMKLKHLIQLNWQCLYLFVSNYPFIHVMSWWIFLSFTLGVWSLLVPSFTPSVSLFPLPGLFPIPILVGFNFLRVTFVCHLLTTTTLARLLMFSMLTSHNSFIFFRNISTVLHHCFFFFCFFYRFTLLGKSLE